MHGNTIARSTNAAIVDTHFHGTNVISSNTINDAPIGIFYLSIADDVFVPNNFYNTTTLITTGATLP